jgi:serine/threonine-protein kinase RsbW
MRPHAKPWQDFLDQPMPRADTLDLLSAVRAVTLELSEASRVAPAYPECGVITLTVPGSLLYRSLVLRVVESACRHVRARSGSGSAHARFEDEVISAFSEAFNNLAIHGYAERPGDVRIEIDPLDDGITIRLLDTGKTFDPDLVAAPRMDELPESGMGVHIIRSFMDVVTYTPGAPPAQCNVLSMTKRLGIVGSTRDASPEEESR